MELIRDNWTKNDYDDFVETDEHTCLMLIRRKWSFRKFVKSIILKVKGMW